MITIDELRELHERAHAEIAEITNAFKKRLQDYLNQRLVVDNMPVKVGCVLEREGIVYFVDARGVESAFGHLLDGARLRCKRQNEDGSLKAKDYFFYPSDLPNFKLIKQSQETDPPTAKL